MSINYSSLFGLFDLTADVLDLNDLTVNGNFQLIQGAHINYVLACKDATGTATWTDPLNLLTLSGDCTGPLNNNQVNSLANGTIPVNTLVTLTANQILTNKTLTLPTISSLINGGTITIPSGTDTLVNLSGIQSLTNKTLDLTNTLSLNGDVTGTSPASIVSTVGGSSAANIHSAELLANAATSLNTINSIVKRDAAGNFTIGTITGSLNGTASTCTTIPNLTGMVTSVGNSTTVVTNANLIGECTSIGNTTTLTNCAVINKVLTGYVSGAGTMNATDSILSAIQKLNGNQVAATGVSTATPNTLMLRDSNADTAIRYLTASRILTAGTVILDTTGTNNIFVGKLAGNQTLSGTDSTFVGCNAGKLLSTGIYNTAIGSGALSAVTTTSANTAVGALSQNVNTGSYNTSIGFNTIGGATTANRCTIAGYDAMQSGNSLDSVAYGYTALNRANGNQNSAIGTNSLFNLSNSIFNDTTALGYNAGNQNQGSQNLFIGSGANNSSSLASTNSIAIGYNASANGSNVCQIGNTSLALINTSADVNCANVTCGVITSSNTSANGLVSGYMYRALNNYSLPASVGGGAFLAWNASAGNAETDFINQVPNSGYIAISGWEFYNQVAGGAISRAFKIDGNGNLSGVANNTTAPAGYIGEYVTNANPLTAI